MDESMNVGMIVEFLVTTLGVIAIIAVISIVTPWLAKHVDKWIANYRQNHSPKENSIYSVRSIYDIPPKEKAQAEAAQGDPEQKEPSEEE